MLLLPSVLKRVAANATDPLERCGQVDGHVRILDEGGDEHLEVGPGRLLVPFALNNGIALGAQQTQRPHVTVKDVDGRETALEAVELEEGDSTGGLVALLVETRVVPEEQHLSVSQIQRLAGRVVIMQSGGRNRGKPGTRTRRGGARCAGRADQAQPSNTKGRR